MWVHDHAPSSATSSKQHLAHMPSVQSHCHLVRVRVRVRVRAWVKVRAWVRVRLRFRGYGQG